MDCSNSVIQVILIEGRAKGYQRGGSCTSEVQQLGDISTIGLKRPRGGRKVSLEPRASRGYSKGAVGWLLIEVLGRMQKICL